MKSNRTPILLSTFVYPGAGQFLQGRWKAGLFYSCCFTVCLILFLSSVIRPIFQTLNAALNWADSGKAEAFTLISPIRLLITFGFALAFYIANIADAARAVRHKQHHSLTQRLNPTRPHPVAKQRLQDPPEFGANR